MSYRSILLAWALAALTLVVAFAMNPLPRFQADSEALVVASLLQDSPSPLGLTLVYAGKERVIDEVYAAARTGLVPPTWTLKPYPAQLGLQGHAFALAGTTDLPLLRAVTQVLNAMAWAALPAWIFALAGWVPFVAAVAALAGSIHFLLFSSNLYWVYGLWIAPAIPFMWWSVIGRSQARDLRTVAALSASAVFAKSLTGYEFLSSIGVLMALPALAAVAANRIDARTAFKAVGWALGAMAAGFAAAYLVHMGALAAERGSFAAAVQSMVHDVAKRTWGLGLELEAVYVASIVNPVHVIWYYLNKMWFAGAGITYLHLLVALALAGPVCARLASTARLLWVVALASFLAPVSWFVLAVGHSAIHVHVNFILWYIGFVPLAAAALMATLQGGVLALRKKYASEPGNVWRPRPTSPPDRGGFSGRGGGS